MSEETSDVVDLDVRRLGTRGLSREWKLDHLIGPLVIVGVPTALIGLVGGPVLTLIGITALVNVMLVVGTYVFVGNSGVVSFGQISFMALGAYTSALVTIPEPQRSVLLPGIPHFIANVTLSAVQATFLGAAVAAVFALIVGVPLMRLRGYVAGMGTFALLQIVYAATSAANNLTGGTSGVAGMATDLTLHAAWIWASAAIVLAFLFQRAKVGLRLRASRESETAAAAAGISIVKERMIAFVLSATIMGAAGALYAHYIGDVSPPSFYISTTFTTLAMLVVGGMTSLLGAALGVVVISTLSELLVRLQAATGINSLREVALAVVLLVTLTRRPTGITGGHEFEARRVITIMRRLTRRQLAH